MSIYTRTGDNGTTSLFGGKRVLKCEELVDVYGSIDELNSWVGLILTEITKDHLKKLFSEIQSDLFTIGGHLAGGKTDLSVLTTRVTQMEVEIDTLEKELPVLNNFILPGGTVTGSRLHIIRSITRRVERQAVALSQKPASPKMASRGGQHVEKEIITYLNRLSDLFFVLARYINSQAHVGEVVWTGTLQHK
jgi:cob(I)alamin adenosyltransferase